MRFTFTPKPKKSAKVYGRALRVSRKNSVVVCRAINKKPLAKGKRLLQCMLDKKESLDGKYYTNTSRSILDLVKSAESNAEFKGLDTGKLFIHASAHKGFTFRRPRRLKMRGQRRKIANVQIVLYEG
jgi:large subunit ribosomal protein L22